MLKLEELPKALNLEIDEGGKAFFPHGWNMNRNMNIRLPHLPDRHFYYPESMRKKRLDAFNRWYAANKHTPFCLGEEIGPYCEQVSGEGVKRSIPSCQDVRILAHAVVKFRKLFFDLASDPSKRDDCFTNSLTLASSAIRHYCELCSYGQSIELYSGINYLQPDTVAIIPDNGSTGDLPFSYTNHINSRLP